MSSSDSSVLVAWEAEFIWINFVEILFARAPKIELETRFARFINWVSASYPQEQRIA